MSSFVWRQAVKHFGENTVLRLPHRVLGTPLAGPFTDDLSLTVVSAGCFWGVEKYFWRLPGVYSTAVGYCGGKRPSPAYEDVLQGNTGHAEAVMVVWRKDSLSFTDILQMFLQCHDPCQRDGQGNDRGSYYRSCVFTTAHGQNEVAKAAIEAYKRCTREAVSTEVLPLEEFYFAEQSHQQYFARRFVRKYCSARVNGFILPEIDLWLPEEFQAEFKPRLGIEFWGRYSPTVFSVHESNQQIDFKPTTE